MIGDRIEPSSVGTALSIAVVLAALTFCVLSILRHLVLSRSRRDDRPILEHLLEPQRRPVGEARRAASPFDRRWSRGVLAFGLAGVSLYAMFHIAGPVAAVVSGGVALRVPFALDQRRARKHREQLEEQFAEYAEAIAMGVRGGLSIPHAFDFALEDAEEPLRDLVERILRARGLGSPFDRVLDQLEEALPTNETRLLSLVLRLHARSGGNLSPAVDQVTSAIRERLGTRRHVHVLSAQARMSGVILAVLPIGFFFVLAASSGADMSPVLRSPAGMALVAAGFALQGLGYLWIRRLLRIGS